MLEESLELDESYELLAESSHGLPESSQLYAVHISVPPLELSLEPSLDPLDPLELEEPLLEVPESEEPLEVLDSVCVTVFDSVKVSVNDGVVVVVSVDVEVGV